MSATAARRSSQMHVAALAAAALLGACQPFVQNTLAPAGPAADAIATIWWALLGISTLVFVVVCYLLLRAFRARRDHAAEEPLARTPLPARSTEPTQQQEGESDQDPSIGEWTPATLVRPTPDWDRRAVRWVLIGGVGVSGLILIATMVMTMVTLREISYEHREADLTIEVVGWQWWWQIRYFDARDELLFETANEVHLPVGQPVRFRLATADVIHSFWIPRLAGKLDMIPGRVNEFTIEASESGTFRGQCAEYCDGPHGLMAFPVIARPEEEFRRWLDEQARDAVAPADSAGLRGLEVFRDKCASCHAVRGATAPADSAPDLTHLGSRLTLAAGTVPNTRGHLGGWIGNPQHVKPGNHMPAVPLAPEELHALLHYLETLR